MTAGVAAPVSIRHDQLVVQTHGRGLHQLGAAVVECATRSGLRDGIVNLWCMHTSCSLLAGENADPEVLRDLERFFARLVIDGDPLFRHSNEGPDDMPAHVRSVLTATSLSIPLLAGRLALGTWQGVFLWEHRHQPQTRRIAVSVLGA